MTVTVLGVRHHGPGSARAVRAALHVLDPDMILVEGPPEADALTRHVPALAPPVAILAHAPDRPGRAAFWPFAEFSPEWQAVRFAAQAGRPVRFIDLPAAVMLAGSGGEDGDPGPDAPDPDSAGGPGADEPGAGEPGAGEPGAGEPGAGGPGADGPGRDPVSADPLGWLSRAAGHDDPERWWEDVVEHRLGGDPVELFAAVAEAMTELRQAAQADGWSPGPREQRREAAMRQGIRAAARGGAARVVVVCGAWHVPALAALPPARADAGLLRGLPRVKASVTWVPWTSRRLTLASGYGAGIASPGWYAHLWTSRDHITERWIARVTALLREADLAASPAAAVEAVRLAEAVAAIRGRSLPGLAELTDAALAVLCQGDEVPLALIRDRLVVGDDLGEVPGDVPTVPLQADFDATCRRLRFRPAAADREVRLDLRGETDRGRSRLLHRTGLLGIGWGERTDAGSTGTFREGWLLRWRPEYVVTLIEQARYGTTVPAAATAVVCEQAEQAQDFTQITSLVEATVLADLPDAMPAVTAALERRSARTSDVAHLMAATPPLARVVRYGSVRQADTALVGGVLDSMLVRICAGLAAACVGIDEAAGAAMLAAVEAADGAIALVGSAAQRDAWHAAQLSVADRIPGGTAPGQPSAADGSSVVAGRCTRMLLDAGVLTPPQAQQRLARALSAAGVAWLEGFLRGSGSLLLRDQRLWQLLDEWLTGLGGEAFETALPLLRRAFSQFTGPERRQMGVRSRAGFLAAGEAGRHEAAAADDWDESRARRVLAVVAAALGGCVRDD